MLRKSEHEKEREKVMFDILSAICVECGKLFGGGDYCSDGLPYHTLSAVEAEAAEAEFEAEAAEAEAEAEAARHDAHHCGLGWCPNEDNCQYLVGV